MPNSAPLIELTDPIQALRMHLQMTTRVLLVEDDPLTRHIVRNTLKDKCFFATAPDARIAQLMITAYRPDIVVLDIGLPDVPGTKVFDWLQTFDPTIGVIVFTGAQNINEINMLMSKGARRVITKPFLRDDLLEQVLYG